MATLYSIKATVGAVVLNQLLYRLPTSLFSMAFSAILPLALVACTIASVTAAQDVPVTVVNKCPSSIDFYIAGTKNATLAQGGRTSFVSPPDGGFFYTSANGGDDAQGTRVGLYNDGKVSVASHVRGDSRNSLFDSTSTTILSRT